MRFYRNYSRLTKEAIQQHFASIDARNPNVGSMLKGHQLPPKVQIPGVQSVICVASGKGGVGKSTTAVNIALSLSRLQKRVGILDADIFGPSIPKMLNLSGKRAELGNDNMFIPPVNYGVKTMSMGFLVGEADPIVWRGMMVTKALKQLMYQVNWEKLDILVVDLPPGTGDVQISIAQQIPLAGALIVSTPQDIALLDVVKGVNMFKKVNVPILGIVQNMSEFICPKCQSKWHIFGDDGAKQTSESMKIPFLGNVPLTLGIRLQSDRGAPIVVSSPTSDEANAYLQIARRLSDDLLLKQQSK